MRTAALVALVAIFVAVPFAALRSEEAEKVRLELSARIVRTADVGIIVTQPFWTD